MSSALAYVPRRQPLQMAAATAALPYLGAFVIVAFIWSNPIVLAADGVAVALVAELAGARRALLVALRYGLPLAVFIVAVNAIVTQRGLTILARGGELPVLGQIDISLEAVVAGGVLALRIVVVLATFAVYSACVDPDRVLRLLRPIAGRSALSASLVARLVPVAAADAARLRQAAELRGPAAAPVGRAALARRLLAGSLERAVDVAATLELRGYALAGFAPARKSRSRRDRRFQLCGFVILCVAVTVRIAGFGGFDAYPRLEIEADWPTLTLAALLPAVALLPFIGRRVRHRRARSSVPRFGGAHA